MNADEFHLNIVDPEQELFSGTVKTVFVPGILGNMQILSKHAPLLTVLEAGTIRIIRSGGEEITLPIVGGILEVQPTMTTVLANARG
jgi:F-type H+-transporting ATPase subunit epsilon